MIQEEIIELAATVAQEIKQFCAGNRNQALFAGGFPRDLDNGRKVKDLDIIICQNPAHGNFDIKGYNNWMMKRKLGMISGSKAYGSRTGNGNNFLVFGDHTLPDNGPIQVIQPKVDALRFVNETFDFGLCQIAMDMDGNLYKSNQYLSDQKNEEMSLMVRHTITPFQLGYALRDHYPRLSKKYPSYKLQVKYMDEMDRNELSKLEHVR